jgi:threonine/homoserine/homoserine lactone efflux protein
MSNEQALAFALFAVVAAISPGPSNIILASAGATAGLVRGIPSLVGVALGMGLMIFLVAFGLGSIVLDHPLVLALLKWGGIGFLAWLAWKIAHAGRMETAIAGEVIGFWRAAAFQWVNPKSWLVSAGAVGALLRHGGASPFAQSATAGVLFALVALPCCAVWLLFGATAQRALRTDRAVRRFNLAMGLLLAASISLFIW